MGSFHSGGTHAHGHGHAGHLHGASHHGGASGSHAAHIGHGGGSASHAHGAGHAHPSGPAHGSGNHGGAGRGGAGHSGTARGGSHSGAARGGAQPSGAHAGGAGGSQAKSASGHLDDGQQALTVSQTTVSARRSEVPTLYLKVLDILSPTKLAFFAFMFGAIGFVTAKFMPGYLSIAPAAILGWLFANIFFNIMGRVFSRMNSSTNFKKESLIGAIGELSLSIEDGGIGEVVVRTGNSRYNYTARPSTPGQTIKKLTKVIVVDIKDGIFVVEPFEDETGMVHP